MLAVLGWFGVLGTLVSLATGVVSLEHAIRTRDDVGGGMWVVAAALLTGVVVMLGPAALAKVAALWRYTLRLRSGLRPATPVDRVATLVPCEPWRARLVEDTRTILRDMDRVADKAAWWPSDVGQPRSSLRRWLGLGSTRSYADFSAINQITRDVWDWLRSVERLPDNQRRALADRGIDVGLLRDSLLADDDFHQRFTAMVHRLRSYERALSVSSDPFRGIGPQQHRASSGVRPPPVRPVVPADREADSAKLRSDFESLVAAHGPALRRKAARFASSPADLEDLYQDMLLAIWNALPQFRGTSSIATYARRIAHSTAVDHVRRRRTVGPEVELEARVSDPETSLADKRRRARLHEEVARLPKRLREVLLLWLEGHNYSAIAAGVGIQEGNVGARLTRARARLRRRLLKA